MIGEAGNEKAEISESDNVDYRDLISRFGRKVMRLGDFSGIRFIIEENIISHFWPSLQRFNLSLLPLLSTPFPLFLHVLLFKSKWIRRYDLIRSKSFLASDFFPLFSSATPAPPSSPFPLLASVP